MVADEMRKKLEVDIATVTWQQLRPHAAVDRLFLVGADPGLLEAGVAFATDDTAQVAKWIEEGHVARPSDSQRAQWEETGEGFRFLILSPFVLAEVVGS